MSARRFPISKLERARRKVGRTPAWRERVYAVPRPSALVLDLRCMCLVYVPAAEWVFDGDYSRGAIGTMQIVVAPMGMIPSAITVSVSRRDDPSACSVWGDRVLYADDPADPVEWFHASLLAARRAAVRLDARSKEKPDADRVV